MTTASSGLEERTEYPVAYLATACDDVLPDDGKAKASIIKTAPQLLGKKIKCIVRRVSDPVTAANENIERKRPINSFRQTAKSLASCLSE